MMLDSSSNYTADFHTNHGDFRIELLTDHSPVAVNNFVFLARQGFYDGLIFHRVIENFMIQGGDPTGTGAGGPGYAFEDEISRELLFDSPGVLAMANAGPNTNGSQFFITTVPTPHLSGSHTIFGEVIEGQSVVDAISRVATNSRNAPLQPVIMERINIIQAPRQDINGTVSSTSLAQYAAQHAGGPGAIYVGDLAQMAGPAPAWDLGDYDGMVPLYSLHDHGWLYESDYYSALIDRANLTNPTELTSSGESITIRHACINRALLPCKLLESYFAPNLEARTKGQLELAVSSFRELGIAAPDTLQLVSNGTLDSATIYGVYVAGSIPAIEIQNLWGIYSSREQEFAANQSILKDIEELVVSHTGGVIMNHSWLAGNDQFFFCKDRVETLNDFEGKKTRIRDAALSDWIKGMGADAWFLAFAEVYIALERGILDCGVTGGDAAHAQRWYEVTDYIMGPLVSFQFVNNVINGDVWAAIPEDLQQILLEEAAKSELEALRLAAIQNEMGLIKNISAGLEFIPFSKELKLRSFNNVVMEHVVPAWINRVGGSAHPIITDTFNNKVGPIVGLRIRRNGSVETVPITEGPYAGWTLEQVLAE